MTKIYTIESNASKEIKAPKKMIIANILNYSKSLEVLKSEEKSKHDIKKVELVLN